MVIQRKYDQGLLLKLWIATVLVGLLSSCMTIEESLHPAATETTLLSNAAVCVNVVQAHTLQWSQVAQFAVPALARVVALDFADDSAFLTAAYRIGSGEKGQVIVWDLSQQQSIRELTLPWLHRQHTQISANGETLITVEDLPNRIALQRKNFSLSKEALDRLEEIIYVWDLKTGEARKMLPRLDYFHIQEIDLSWDGGTVVSVHTGGIDLNSTEVKSSFGGEGLGLYDNEREDGVENPVVVVLNRKSNTYAYGLDDGDVYIRTITPELTSHESRRFPSGFYPGIPTALAFDANGRRLAIARTHSLEIRDLDSSFAFFWPSQYSSDPSTAFKKVVFHPQDDLLGVITDQGWQLRHTEDLSLLQEQSDHRITELAFSDDGCYVAVGEEGGTVQVWQR